MLLQKDKIARLNLGIFFFLVLLTYCACVGQEEETARSKSVAGRKFWYWIMSNFFFLHEQKKYKEESVYVYVCLWKLSHL